MQLAHSVGAFTKVLAGFNNGVVYEHFPGRIMNYHDLIKPEIIKKLMKVLYDFHHADGKNIHLIGMKGEDASKDMINKSTCEMIKDFIINQIPDTHPDERMQEKFQAFKKEFPNEVLLAEFELIQSVLGEMGVPDDVLQHGDVHPRNMLINDETGDIVLIDFEMTTLAWRAQDLGRFVEMKPALVDMGGKIATAEEPDITPEIRQLWLRSYLETKAKAACKSPDSITDDQMEMFDIEVKVFSIICEFEMIAFCGVPFDFGEGLDMFGALPGCKRRFYAQKEDLITLKDRYIELKNKGVQI